MPHHENPHLMHRFFHEKEVNEIYISIFLVALAEAMIGIFIPIYLFKGGFEMQQILLYYFMTSLYFVLFAIPASKITARLGAKHSILLSTPFLILYYLGLRFVHVSTLIFFILPLLAAIRMMFYNYGYHINFIRHSDRKSRGKEISYMGILSSFATIVAPVISGFVIFLFGYNISFTISSLILFASTIPLLLSKDVYEKHDISTKELWSYSFKGKNIRNILSFVGYSVESRIGMILWPIFLIGVLITTKSVGLLATLSLGLTAITFYLIRKLIKRYGNDMLIKFSTLLYFAGWIGRIFANTSTKIFFVDTYKNLAERTLHVPWSVKSYEIAGKKNHFVFIVSREIIINAARLAIIPVLMMVFYIGYHPFVISFMIASLATLLYPFLRK